MPDVADSRSLLVDLETRQDELLRQLDELNRRIEQALVQSRMQIHFPKPAEEESAA
jgi:hypothetical protein